MNKTGTKRRSQNERTTGRSAACHTSKTSQNKHNNHLVQMVLKALNKNAG